MPLLYVHTSLTQQICTRDIAAFQLCKKPCLAAGPGHCLLPSLAA